MSKLEIKIDGEIYNRNFPSALHRAAQDTSNGLRPALEHVNFINGYAYVSDGHILVRQSFDFIDIKGIENLEGKSLHRNVYYRIFRERNATIIAHPENIELQLDDYLSFGSRMFFDYSKEVKVPDYEAILSEAISRFTEIKTIDYKQIALNQTVLNRLLSAMKIEGTGIILSYPNHANRSILITDSDSEYRQFDKQVGLIMPIILDL